MIKQIFIIFNFCLLITWAAGPIEWGTIDKIQTQDLFNAARFKSKMLNDVMWRNSDSSNKFFGENKSKPATWAHEGSHDIDRRCSFSAGCGINGASRQGAFCCFYIGGDTNNRVILGFPLNVMKTNCEPYLPESLRDNRFEQYFKKNNPSEANRHSNYILEEWNAYINGGTAALQVLDMNTWPHEYVSDLFSGQVEFAIYYTACAKAIQTMLPNYFNENPNHFNFYQFELERTFDLYHQSRRHERFRKFEDGLFNTLTTKTDGKVIRDTIQSLFGVEFYNQVVLNQQQQQPQQQTTLKPNTASLSQTGARLPTQTYNPDAVTFPLPIQTTAQQQQQQQQQSATKTVVIYVQDDATTHQLSALIVILATLLLI